LHEYQKKGVAKFAIRNFLKTKNGQNAGQGENPWLGGAPTPRVFLRKEFGFA
jgi:hypothetical protein